MQGWFYCNVPLIRSPNLGRGKGVYAMHPYMTELNFVSDPPFDMGMWDHFAWVTRPSATTWFTSLL
jgi:hypothetical protein